MQDETALLIANGDYARDMGALKQLVSEVRELKSALESIGFNVTLVQNADLEAMQKALAAFKANPDDEFSVGYRCIYVDEGGYEQFKRRCKQHHFGFVPEQSVCAKRPSRRQSAGMYLIHRTKAARFSSL